VQDDRRRRFELLALPHLDAAYNLARWLAGNAADAEDVLQDAYLRAFRYFDAFRGGSDIRVWLLSIVRNTFLSWVKENRSGRLVFVPDDRGTGAAEPAETMWGEAPRDPETLMLRSADAGMLNRLIEDLPTEYREVLLLREVEEMSYRDIAVVIGVPIGTVMSRLARSRATLRHRWHAQFSKENAPRENRHGV
jgi:RNA polymerase sigma-70 factor (ECF subfamily)